MNALDEIIRTLKNANNEGTRAPYWLILDPQQNMSCNIHNLAGQITGPFFSRKDAVQHLERRRYAFSDRACVFCHSGHASKKYLKFCDEICIEKDDGNE